MAIAAVPGATRVITRRARPVVGWFAAAGLAAALGLGGCSTSSPPARGSVARVSHAGASDPFALDDTVRRGPYRGRRLDTSEQRSVWLLSREEASAIGLAPAPGRLLAANVRHAGRYWIAEIAPGGVSDVIVQLEQFPAVVPAAHCEMRFRFAPGAEPLLRPQTREGGGRALRLRDLVYSVEAVPVVGGDSYDLWRGLWDHYGNAYRLCSLADRYQAMVVRAGHRVEQLRLVLTPDQRRAVLEAALRRGDHAQMNVMYNTISRNCATEVYRALDDVVRYDAGGVVLKFAASPLETFPTQAKLALRARGLLDRSSELPDLAREFGAAPGAASGKHPRAQPR
jgi:hypothetical protein